MVLVAVGHGDMIQVNITVMVNVLIPLKAAFDSFLN